MNRIPQHKVYGPLINLIQDMWEEHNEAVQGVCMCNACESAKELFEALIGIGEQYR